MPSRASLILLTGIFLLGVFFRIANLSPFNVYPDSYQNLIVAKNIADYHSVLGYLGKNGMIYPDFFSWTHPVYPLLINIVTTITHTMTISARFIAFFAGVLAIPLAYFYIKRVFQSSAYGIVAAFFIAFSFNHTVWSGFLMTETTGVFIMLLFLLSFFTHHKSKKGINLDAVISGVLFAIAVLTRYEYSIVLLPVAFYLFFNGNQMKRFFTLFFAFGLTLALFVWQLYPLPSTITVIGNQLGSILLREGIGLFIFFIVILSISFLPWILRQKIIKHGSFTLIGFLWLMSLYLVLQELFGSPQWYSYADFSALRHFIFDDELLSVFSLVGFTMLLTNNKTRMVGVFALLVTVFLFASYHHINPDMERYMTHLIPFLLIPASYGFVSLFKKEKGKVFSSLFFATLILLILLQGIQTINGMKYSQDSSWYSISYEDKAATVLKKYIPEDKNILLITSYPEPYYSALHVSTQSIADTYPYIFIDNVTGNQRVLIIEDMGMHNDFPHFTNFLKRNLLGNKRASFWVNEKFHYINTVQQEKYPVTIYQISLKDLKAKLKSRKID